MDSENSLEKRLSKEYLSHWNKLIGIIETFTSWKEDYFSVRDESNALKNFKDYAKLEGYSFSVRVNSSNYSALRAVDHDLSNLIGIIYIQKQYYENGLENANGIEMMKKSAISAKHIINSVKNEFYNNNTEDADSYMKMKDLIRLIEYIPELFNKQSKKDLNIDISILSNTLPGSMRMYDRLISNVAADHIYRTFTNIIKNKSRIKDESGELISGKLIVPIRIIDEKDYLKINCYESAGIPLPEKYAKEPEKIFVIGDSTEGENRGLGMGSSKIIIESLGGTIKAYSTNNDIPNQAYRFLKYEMKIPKRHFIDY